MSRAGLSFGLSRAGLSFGLSRAGLRFGPLGRTLGSRPGARRFGLGSRLLAGALLFTRHRHWRHVRSSPITLDYQITQHSVIEPEGPDQLIQGFLAALDIHQKVVGLVDLVD